MLVAQMESEHGKPELWARVIITEPYWEQMAGKIDLSMPESLEFFKFELEKAKEKHHEGIAPCAQL